MHDWIYQSGLSLIGWVRTLLPRRGLVLCLHSIADDGADFPGPMAVTTGFLEALITDVRRCGIPVLSVADALAISATDSDEPYLVLTFDDGYRGVFSHAFPLLKQLEAPFAVFVTTGLLDGHLPMWWDAIERFVATATDVQLEHGAAPTTTARQKNAIAYHLTSQLRSMSVPQRNAVLHDHAMRNPALDLRGAYTRALTWPMLEVMASSPLVTIGAHTVNHPLISSLPEREAAWECAEARARLRDVLGAETKFMAYPYGQEGEIGPYARRSAAAAGFTAAFTTRAAPMPKRALGDALALPRVLLSRKGQSPAIVSAYMTGVPAALRRNKAA